VLSLSMESTGDRIKAVLLRVPRGRVTSYGGVATIAGIPNGARTVARILHSSSASDGLPWWRIVRADGGIALSPGAGLEEQRAALEAEGVRVDEGGRVDLGEFGWYGSPRD